MPKCFKNTQEQIEILKRRGLFFKDESYAENYLLMNNYYNVINYCSKGFEEYNNCSRIDNRKIESSYKIGVTFDEIKSVHFYDQEIKSAIFKYIILCEQHFRSVVSHVFCKHHTSPYACLNINSYDFKPETVKEISKLIFTLSKTINYFSSNSLPNSIEHYIKNHNDVPYWVLSNFVDFGTLISIYRLMKFDERKEVRKEFEKELIKNTNNPQSAFNPKGFMRMLNNIHALRNVVAHNGKLFDFQARETPTRIIGLHDQFNLSSTSMQDVFSTVICMYCFLTKNEFAQLYNTLKKRSKNLKNSLNSISPNVIYLKLGFPADFHLTPSLSQ